MFKIFKHRTVKEKVAKKEYPVSNFIPYQWHWNDHTIVTKNNELLQVVKIGGFSFETADDEDVDIRKDIRNILLKGMATGHFTLYFHTIRRKQNVYGDEGFDPNMPDGFARYLDDQWRAKHKHDQSYVNELYITVIRKADTKGAAIVEHMFKRLKETTSKVGWELGMKEAYDELEEITSRITTSLRNYTVEVLGTKETSKGVYSDLLRFLGTLVNCGVSVPILVPTSDLSKYLATERLLFSSKNIEATGMRGKRYAAVVSIKEYGPKTYAGMLDSFLQMPFEFIMSQSFAFINRQIAVGKMQMQQNRMASAGDKAVSQMLEISGALDMAMSGDIGFGTHHFSVLCFEKSPKALENAVSMAVVALSNAGMTPIRERVFMEQTYWASLPGNSDYAARASTINTLNMSSLASLHNYPTGKKVNNHWGNALTVFDTTSGTPFYFNFHLRDVGHTTIIGPTGSGKTVLMNFLCAQAQKYNSRLFFFDKDRGSEIFIRALDGHHVMIDPSQNCGFNPLQLPDTGENRTFILEWLKQLVCTHGETINAEDIKVLSEAVAGNYKLDPKDRRLTNVVPFLGIEGPDALATRIAMWHGIGSHAKIFDNEVDGLVFENNNIFGFEMGELLKDPMALGPVLMYLFHKINLSLDGTPTMIVLDEAWALIDNPVFAPRIKDWLKVLRKLNAMVVFATQSVEDASKSAISDTLIQQTATQIFLPNLKATDVYRTAFMLTEREFILIKNTDPGSRFFLVKQGQDAVVARIDLGGMDDVINLLSGRSDTVILLDEIRKEVGDDPAKWIPLFNQRVKALQEQEG